MFIVTKRPTHSIQLSYLSTLRVRSRNCNAMIQKLCFKLPYLSLYCIHISTVYNRWKADQMKSKICAYLHLQPKESISTQHILTSFIRSWVFSKLFNIQFRFSCGLYWVEIYIHHVNYFEISKKSFLLWQPISVSDSSIDFSLEILRICHLYCRWKETSTHLFQKKINKSIGSTINSTIAI